MIKIEYMKIKCQEEEKEEVPFSTYSSPLSLFDQNSSAI